MLFTNVGISSTSIILATSMFPMLFLEGLIGVIKLGTVIPLTAPAVVKLAPVTCVIIALSLWSASGLLLLPLYLSKSSPRMSGY